MASRVEEMRCTHGDENIEGDESEDEDDDISSGSMRKRKKIFALRKNFRKLRFSFAFSMKPKLCFCIIRGDVFIRVGHAVVFHMRICSCDLCKLICAYPHETE